MWLCECDCGVSAIVALFNLLNGNTKSCGCMKYVGAAAANMGPRPFGDHSLDRYPNNDGNYEPGNCRWATRIEQARNTSANKRIDHDGRSLTVAEWSEISGVKSATIRARLAKGWSAADSIYAVPYKRSA